MYTQNNNCLVDTYIHVIPVHVDYHSLISQWSSSHFDILYFPVFEFCFFPENMFTSLNIHITQNGRGQIVMSDLNVK